MKCQDHFVQFFAGDHSLTDSVTGFVRRGLSASEVCVVIATDAHRHHIESTLHSEGFDIAALTASSDYIPVDANFLLGELLRNQKVDRVIFHEQAGLLLMQAASRYKPVRIFGEMVALLASRRLYSAVIDLEEMCNELSMFHDFNMFCAYPLHALNDPGCRALAEHISRLHSQPPPHRFAQ